MLMRCCSETIQSSFIQTGNEVRAPGSNYSRFLENFSSIISTGATSKVALIQFECKHDEFSD